MGRTTHVKEARPFLTKTDGTRDGAVVGRIVGTYFHGLFENTDFTTTFLTQVAESRQLDWRPQPLRLGKDEEYNRLAAAARQYLDIPKIRELLET
jgi:adenosylcobyric acid synthase